MMDYIRVVVDTGVVVGGGVCQDEASGFLTPAEGEQIIFGVASPGLTERWLYVDGELVNTHQPNVPPMPWTVWDAAARAWADGRTEEVRLAEAWVAVRAQRNQLLADCDWTQLADVPLPNREAWAAYRQALRDVTQQQNPEQIVWPQPPE